MEEDLEEQDPPVAISLYFCPRCDEEVFQESELVAMEVAVYRTDGKPVRIATDDNGNYAFPPYLLHLECWEWMESEAREESADRPPETSHPLHKCHICEERLDDSDPCVSITGGELRESRVDGLTFRRQGAPVIVCVLCLATEIEDHLCGWEELPEFLTEKG